MENSPSIDLLGYYIIREMVTILAMRHSLVTRDTFFVAIARRQKVSLPDELQNHDLMMSSHIATY